MQKIFFYLLILLLFISCVKEEIPKPSGELRLEYPNPVYQPFLGSSFYSFDYSKYAVISNAKKPNWYYLNYPKMKAKVFITYFPIQNNLLLQLKETEKMVFGHSKKASAIDTKSFSYPDKKVYGNFYELKGQSASNIQFYITDSTHHFVNGYLYFNSRPKPDSLGPAVDYVKKDLQYLISTFKWKK